MGFISADIAANLTPHRARRIEVHAKSRQFTYLYTLFIY